MKTFMRLVEQLEKTNRTNDKVNYLETYFKTARPEDKVWVIALFTHRRPRGVIKLSLLKQWAIELSGLPEWLFQESYHHVGDLAETLSLLGKLPENIVLDNERISNQLDSIQGLSDVFDKLLWLKDQEVEVQRSWVLSMWNGLSSVERFVFNKLLTGGFRIGVSEQLLFKSVARAAGLTAMEVQQRLMGNWKPQEVSYAKLILQDLTKNSSVPFPFALCYSLEEVLEDGFDGDFAQQLEHKLGSFSDWQVEWKWDGIRAQLVKRGDEIWLWSRGEELINDTFPEIMAWQQAIEFDAVLDGELLVWQEGVPASFQYLQRRLGRKRVGKKMMQEYPVVFMVYDVLEFEGTDARGMSTWERRKLLARLVERDGIRISPVLTGFGWKDVIDLRMQSKSLGTEGLMIKRGDSAYVGGRKRGDWWKWKVAPETVDCVLIYAQRGHGKRASLYTDFTFAVRDGDKLVPFAKAYSGLTNAELVEINAWLKHHTRESFGPVRSVDAELVFEVAFEGISLSIRHKSGIAVRFPRIVRWRKDKTVDAINTLQDLQDLIHHSDRIT